MVDFHHEWLLEGMQLSASSSRCAYDAHFRITNEREERGGDREEKRDERRHSVASRSDRIIHLCSPCIALYNDCITRIKSGQTCCLRRNYFTLRNAIVYRWHLLFGEYIAVQREHVYYTRQFDNIQSERHPANGATFIESSHCMSYSSSMR